MTWGNLLLTFSALLHIGGYPFLLECFANETWLGSWTTNGNKNKNNEYCNRKKPKPELPPPWTQYPPITDHCDLSGKRHFHWIGQWPQGSKTPLRVILYRCQEPEVSREKMKAIHSSNDIGLWYHKAIWAQSSKVRKARKDWWLEKYYISKVWQAIKRNYSFYDCVAEAPQGYLY